MAVRGSSTTSMGSFSTSPRQDRQDPVSLSPLDSEQPLLSTSTVTTRGPTIGALSSGALSHQEERSPLMETPPPNSSSSSSNTVMIPIPSEQPSDDDNNNDDAPPTTTTSANATTATATVTTLLLEARLKELRSRERHLRLLRTGSFFLLPSALPYLASSLVTYFTLEMEAEYSHDTVAEDGRVGRQRGGLLPWMVPWIPLVGVMVPIVLAKVLTRIQGCKNQRETRCPYERVRRAFSGKWAARSCDAPSPLSSLEAQEEEKEKEDAEVRKVDDEGCDTGLGLGLGLSLSSAGGYHLETKSPLRSRVHKISRRRLVPRSRTILMTSLCAWILLLASAPHLGLNQPETLVSVMARQGHRDSIVQKQTERQEQEQEEEEEVNSPFASILRSASPPNPLMARPNPWEDDEQQRQQEQEYLEALIRAAEDDDVLDWEVKYSIIEPGDLLEDPAEMTVMEEVVTMEKEEEQQQQPQEHVVRLFKYVPFATEIFMFLLAVCLGGMSVGLDQIRSQTQQSQAEWEQQLEEELVHSRQCESSDQARAYIQETMDHDDKQQGHTAWTWACGTLAVAGLSLNYWLVISLCHWNIPSLYFVGLGCAAMLLVHAWVPENDDNDKGDDTMATPQRSTAGRSYLGSYNDNEKGLSC
ncbi:hypothetical protein BGZ70_000732 [Mortierella alpina]|uniref:Uncharacterized protein n=1 Tax=Mortierella alpina TaxID=64518 RepID=A0A9P6M5A1_MORAP|nr:hypothetical protein BGZ70_000732 [Mortierella alpina]